MTRICCQQLSRFHFFQPRPSPQRLVHHWGVQRGQRAAIPPRKAPRRVEIHGSESDLKMLRSICWSVVLQSGMRWCETHGEKPFQRPHDKTYVLDKFCGFSILLTPYPPLRITLLPWHDPEFNLTRILYNTNLKGCLKLSHYPSQ